MGVPGTDSETGLRLDTNGAIFYVDPNAVGVSDGRDGTDPTEPLQTVATALTYCQAYRNDVIVVAPNSNWEYGNTAVGRATAIAEEVTVSVPGVRIVGLAPAGYYGVYWNPVTDSGVCITIDAMDVLVEGFAFWDPNALTNPVGILIEWDAPPYGDNVTVRHCYFGEGLDIGIRMDFAWNCHIHDNVFVECDDVAIHNLSAAGDPDYLNLHDNLFMDNTLAISLTTTDNAMIYRNHIYGTAGGTNNFIDLTGGNSNLVADNWLGCTIGQYDVTCSDATSGAWINNHCTNGDTTAPPV
jgi:hypothetical protein